MAPSLSDLYQIIKLPRISNIPIQNRCIVGATNDSAPAAATAASPATSDVIHHNNSYLHLAISSLSISSYVLVPSPKLAWSYSLPLSVIVKYLAVFEDLAIGATYFAASLYNSSTKKYSLKVIVNKSLHSKSVKTNIASNVAAEDVNVEENGASNTDLDVVDVDFSQEITGIKFSKNGQFIYVLLENGDIQSYQFSADSKDSYSAPVSEYKPIKKRQSSVVFSTQINHVDVSSGSVALVANNNDGFLLQVKKAPGNNLTSSIVLLSNGEIFEVSSNVAIESNEASSETKQQTKDEREEFIFSYNSGILYKLSVKEQSLSLHSVPSNATIKTVSLKPLFNNVSTSLTKQDIGIVSPSLNRILLNLQNYIFLINTKYETILGDYSLPLAATTGKDDNARCLLLNCGEAKGTFSKNSSTSLNLIMLDDNDNSYSVHNLAVDVGNSSLVESLGKGIELYCERHQFNKDNSAAVAAAKKNKEDFVVEYLATEDICGSSDLDKLLEKSAGLSISLTESEEVEKFVKKLTTAAKHNKPQEFDLTFINFIKHHKYGIEKIQSAYEKIAAVVEKGESYDDNSEDWVQIRKFVLKNSKSKKLDYEMSNALFNAIFELIFAVYKPEAENNSTDNELFEYSLKSDEFVPQLSLIYLLNSYLFPPAYSLNGLLRKFKSEPIILNTLVTNYDIQLSVEDILLFLSELSEGEEVSFDKENKDDKDEEMEDEQEIKNQNSKNLLFKKLVKLLVTSKSEFLIVKSVKYLLDSSRKEHAIFNNNFEKLLFKIIKLNYGIKLLNLIIDGIGILNFKFSNDESKMTQLVKYSDSKIAEIIRVEPVESLLDELIGACEVQQCQNDQDWKRQGNAANNRSGDKKNKSQEPRIVSVKNSKMEEKLGAIIGLNDEEKEEDEDKIGSYSVERLINLY